MACHYLIPDIVGAGYAAWSQGARSVGNDLRLEHETALHDVAAGLAFLRGQGFDHIVLLGNSGAPACTPSMSSSRRCRPPSASPARREASLPAWPGWRCPRSRDWCWWDRIRGRARC